MKNNFFDFKIFAVPDTKDTVLRAEGKGQKGVLILCRFSKDHVEERRFLKRILQAVQLDLERDAFLINTTNDDTVSLSTIQRQLGIEQVISFGLPAAQLGLRFKTPLYQVMKHRNASYLFVDDLQSIHEERQRGEKQRASQLWAALQQAFPDRVDS